MILSFGLGFSEAFELEILNYQGSFSDLRFDITLICIIYSLHKDRLFEHIRNKQISKFLQGLVRD